MTYALPPVKRGKNKPLADALRSILEEAKQHQAPLCVTWMLYWYYLQGVRRFPVVHWDKGVVTTSYVRQKGTSPFKYAGALERYNTEKGRLGEINVSHWVEPTAEGLMNHQDAARHMLVLDMLLNPENVDEVVGNVRTDLLIYGTAAIEVVLKEKIGPYGKQVVLKNVPPWEMTPIPAGTFASVHVRGESRDRFVSYEMFIEKFGLSQNWINSNAGDLETRSLQYGGDLNNPNEQNTVGVGGSPETHRDLMDREDNQIYVHLHEVWIYNDQGNVARYIARCGDAIAMDVSFSEEEATPRPIYVSRYIDTGRYYGQSFMDLAMSMSRAAERLMSRLFENMETMSSQGILLVPMDAYSQDLSKATKRTQDGLTLIPWEPTPGGKHAPMHIMPPTSGTMPGQVASFSVEQLEKLTRSSTPDIPARTDSPNMVAMLDQISQRTMTDVRSSLNKQFGQAYRAAAFYGAQVLASTNPVALPRIDDRLAGIPIAARDGQIIIDQVGFMPRLDGVRFRIKDVDRRSREAIKQELVQLMQVGVLGPFDLILADMEFGLGLAIPETSLTNSVKFGMVQNMMLFGDGETPGEVLVRESGVDTKIVLQMIDRFTSRPLFQFASQAVREAFAQLRETYLMVMTVPKMSNPQGPPPEEILAQARGEGRRE